MRRRKRIRWGRIILVMFIIAAIAGIGAYFGVPKLMAYLEKKEAIKNDKTAPGGLVTTVEINVNDKIVPEDIIYDIFDNVSDEKDIKVKFKENYSFSTQGVYNVVVLLEDEAGNIGEVNGSVKVYGDVITPQKSDGEYAFLVPTDYVVKNEAPTESITPIGLPVVKSTPTKINMCTEKRNSDLEYEFKDAEQTAELKSYNFYGESLNLYGQEYTGYTSNTDPFVGSSIVLVNICTGQETSFKYSANIDENIKTAELEAGTYEVYIKTGSVLKRLISSELVFDTMYTVTRDSTNKKVQIIANKELENKVLTQNQVYITVKEIPHSELPKGVYDIVLDPGHYSIQYGKEITWIAIDMGATGNGLTEGTANYLTATELKSILEAKGLKVQITRQYAEDVILEFGINSRIHTSYLSQAKFYFACHLNTSPNASTSGSEIYTTRFGSKKLADTISSSLKNSKIRVNNSSIQYKFGIFDYYHFIRETGGNATMAGQELATGSGANSQTFARTTHGAHGLLLELAYISNPAEAQNWKDNYKSSVQEVANGLFKYLGIE